MKRFKNILVVTQGQSFDNEVLRWASRLARTNHARLTLTSVVKPPTPWVSRMDHYLDLHRQHLRTELQRLEQIAAILRGDALMVETEVLSGTDFLEIIKRVLRKEHDLVMIGAVDERGITDSLLNGTIMHLMRKCPCPVWVAKPTEAGHYRRIVAAVDVVPCDTERDTLNDKILTLAISMAQRERAQLHIVHAWSLYGENLLRKGNNKLPSDAADRIYKQMRAMHREWLDELLARYETESVEHQIHLVDGEASNVIVERTHLLSGELVVMGTVGRTGIPGLLIGNTAETVLGHIRCSVLAVKPDGFVSPIGAE
jgi:universal stress protein E